MKQSMKNLLSCLAFLLVVVTLMGLLSPVLRPKDNREEFGMDNIVANAVLGEPKDSVELLILGDSEAYCAYIPMQLWSEQGIAGAVYSTVGQKLHETEYFLKSVLARHRLKVLVLETNVIFSDVNYVDLVEGKLSWLMPSFFYHDRWKNLRAEDLTSPVRYTYQDPDRGYIYRRDIASAYPEDYMEPDDSLAPLSWENRLLLGNIRDICEENNVKLILVSTPSPVNWNYARHNRIADIAESWNVDYLDLNLLPEEIPVDWELDTFDEGDHLNYYGAEKTTAYLGQYLAETGLLADHREDSGAVYDQWRQDAAEFYEFIAQEDAAEAAEWEEE